MARRRKESEEREENWRGNKAKKLGREGEGRNKEKWTKVHFLFLSLSSVILEILLFLFFLFSLSKFFKFCSPKPRKYY